MRIWSKEEVNFEKCKKMHFKFDIHRIESVRGFPPVVICTNGAVDLLSNIKDTHKTGKLRENDVIVKSQAFVIKDKLCVLCLIKNQDNDFFIDCHKFSEDSEDCWSCESTKIDITEDRSVCSCDMKQFGNDVKCYILCSNGNLYTVTVSPASNSVKSHNACRIQCVQNNVAMVILNLTHIAISGIQQNNQNGLGIYDTRFNVLHTFKPFIEPVTDDIKLFHRNNCLFTSFGKTLYMYPYSCQRSTVANILGKQNVLSEETYTDNTVAWIKSTHQGKKSQKEEDVRQLLQKLSDTSKIKEYGMFEKSFKILKISLTDSVSHSSLMLKFLQRCLSEDKFFPKAEIEELISMKVIPSILVPYLFDSLIKHGETHLLVLTLQYLSDIPESCLCKTLQFILSSEDKDLPQRNNSTESLEDCPLSLSKLYYINQILQMPFNDVFLVECIRTLSFKNVLVLLEYLYYLLNKGPDDIEDIVNNPSLPQVVDWICCLLDGHFTQLIISPDARVVLVNLHSIVQSQVEFYDDLLSLDALLQQLKTKCDIPQNKMVGQYCIEVLHIL